MNILLYANYLLNADVLQPEPSEGKKMFSKLYWNLWSGWYCLYLMGDKKCGE